MSIEIIFRPPSGQPFINLSPAVERAEAKTREEAFEAAFEMCREGGMGSRALVMQEGELVRTYGVDWSNRMFYVDGSRA